MFQWPKYGRVDGALIRRFTNAAAACFNGRSMAGSMVPSPEEVRMKQTE